MATEAERFYKQIERKRKQAQQRSRLELQLPPTSVAAEPRGTVTQPIPHWDNYQNHPGHGLIPQTIVQIYRTAEFGFPMEQCDLFDDLIETDGHLRSVIAARTLAVSGKKWQVKAGGDQPIDARAAQMLEQALRQTNFGALMEHLLSTRYYGYAGSEIVWDMVNGETVPTWFINVPCRRFRFDKFDRPRLITESDFEGVELRAGQWVFGKNSTSGTTPRSGLMRTAAWFSLWKKYSWRDWIIYGEKFGIPLVLGKYREGSSEEDKRALEDAVHDLGGAGQATMSDETEIEIKEAAQGGDSTNLHASIVKEANKELSKLITGSTLTVEQGGPGSFALGEVHENRSFDLVRSDAMFVSRRFAQDIAKPFLEFNGLEAAQLPELIIHIQKAEGLTRVKEAETLLAMGLTLDSEQLREEHNYRAPPSDDRALVQAAPVTDTGGDDAE